VRRSDAAVSSVPSSRQGRLHHIASHKVVLLEIQLKYRVLHRGEHKANVLRVCNNINTE